MENTSKKRFEVRLVRQPGGFKKDIYIDGQLLDYSVDVESYREACGMGPQYKLAVQRDIVKHFTNAVSETLGRKVTAEQIEEAQKTGWI